MQSARWTAAIVLLLGLACTTPPPARTLPAPPVGGAAAAPPAGEDSLTQARHRMADSVLKQIQGHENEPATQVFMNVKALTFNINAGQLVRAMDIGFGRSLGVGCEHCHVVRKWESDSMRAKRVARFMISMNGLINNELAKAPDFARAPTVACMTSPRRGAAIASPAAACRLTMSSRTPRQ